ncbi:hypothetical protein CYLTODRAFT_487303 [Cylindrobasidium torrendii FP15055 ss-10]|uniref:F-box domain-containing protein n=1 Tax=Cylindrobasidium torrendii FP15055 ss-10 TaxID=1314674 RepID=A0A0D7BLF7_9AGAR|nr:hypothetical protein CYLTODRAFT_487303 [Cylindrobasidium torrendii FP15055 ss-10]
MPPRRKKSAKPSKNTALLPDADTKYTSGKRKRGDNNDLVLCQQKDSAKKPRLEEEISFRLLEIPTDILYEICSHLPPLGLLHLSRTCKTIRAILMSEASRYAWRSSFESILLDGIREVRNDICEPRLATLLFENRCDGCQKPRRGAAMPEFMLRVNMCQSCLESSPEFLDPDDLDAAMQKVVPNHANGYRYRLAMIGRVTPYGSAVKEAYDSRVYDRASFLEMVEETKDLDVDEFETWHIAEKENFRLFQDECKQLWDFKAYMDEEAKEQKNLSKGVIVTQRLKDIAARFMDAGYVTVSLDGCDNQCFWDRLISPDRPSHTVLECWRLVSRPIPLTDKEWNKGVILKYLIHCGCIIRGNKLRDTPEKKEHTEQVAKKAQVVKRRPKA